MRKSENIILLRHGVFQRHQNSFHGCWKAFFVSRHIDPYSAKFSLQYFQFKSQFILQFWKTCHLTVQNKWTKRDILEETCFWPFNDSCWGGNAREEGEWKQIMGNETDKCFCKVDQMQICPTARTEINEAGQSQTQLRPNIDTESDIRGCGWPVPSPSTDDPETQKVQTFRSAEFHAQNLLESF